MGSGEGYLLAPKVQLARRAQTLFSPIPPLLSPNSSPVSVRRYAGGPDEGLILDVLEERWESVKPLKKGNVLMATLPTRGPPTHTHSRASWGVWLWARKQGECLCWELGPCLSSEKSELLSVE